MQPGEQKSIRASEFKLWCRFHTERTQLLIKIESDERETGFTSQHRTELDLLDKKYEYFFVDEE